MQFSVGLYDLSDVESIREGAGIMVDKLKKRRVQRCVQRYWWVVPVLLILLPLPFHLPRLLPTPPDIQVTIHRSYSSEEAYTRLQVAEVANYSAILELPPFMYSGDDLTDPDYQSYIWLNYVNNATIEYLSNRIANKTASLSCPDITFRYLANATWYANASFWVMGDRFIARNKTSGQEVSWELYGVNNLVRYYVNGSFQEEALGESLVSLHDVGIVYLELFYFEGYGLMAAFNTEIKQIVLINSSRQILFVLVSNLGLSIA